MYTLLNTVNFSGIGLHSGQSVNMKVAASRQAGITFVLDQQPIQAVDQYIGTNHIRSTQLNKHGLVIQTPEHFLSACYALRLTQIQVELSHYELPILDGSAQPFIDALLSNRIPISKTPVILDVKRDLDMDNQGSRYMAMPHSDFCIHAYVSYPDHWVKSMSVQYTHSLDAYTTQIAPARTYGFTHELDALYKQGLAKGGSTDNALVITDTGYMNQPRFSDELARHKILDFIGDLSLLGMQLKGQFILVKPSHQGNIAFLKYLKKQLL